MTDRAVAYDLVTETALQLNATAGQLLALCDGERDMDAAVDAWAKASGIGREVISKDVENALSIFTEVGLVGREEWYVGPQRPVGSNAPAPEGSGVGEAHRVIDYDISFRSAQPGLVSNIDDFLGTGPDRICNHVGGSGAEAAIVFDVNEEPSGHVVLVTDYEWDFPSRGAFFDQLTQVMNEYAVWTHSCLALHAGAVRSPDGEIVLLPAPSGAGKSTLTGAFMAAGWDYLGDEAIGVRPGTLDAVGYPKRLSINGESRQLLGLAPNGLSDLDPAELNAGIDRLCGDVGPVNRVVLPTYIEAARATIEDLSVDEAVVEILANTLNLARSQQAGLSAACDLAARVPVQRVVHCDAHTAVALIEDHARSYRKL